MVDFVTEGQCIFCNKPNICLYTMTLSCGDIQLRLCTRCNRISLYGEDTGSAFGYTHKFDEIK